MKNSNFTKTKLYLKNGDVFEAKNFGFPKSVAGEVVFATGMTGYPEALTDPSFRGQILIFTYPIIGNYGVPKKEFWESEKIQVAGLIVSQYIDTPSHHENMSALAEWFKKEKIPLLEIKDTRLLTEKIREEGSMLGKIITGKNIPYENPNTRNLVAEVSTKEIYSVGKGNKNVVLIDCGTKKNIAESVAKREIKVTVVPWDTDITKLNVPIDAVIISNG